ncbi:hypothetical protein BIV25_43740 [Streptomyces sp. MUSC 14]|nr:hypothetical protein BIV25_43740 [Streptomyces sp. MUSC 14]
MRGHRRVGVCRAGHGGAVHERPGAAAGPLPPRAVSKAMCRAAWVASMVVPMPVRERSRAPRIQPSVNTAAHPAASAHRGGMAPMASPCPAAASSTHTTANTAARRPHTAGDALMVRESPTVG